MFGHIYINAIRVAVRERVSLFWSFVFPIILATFMFLAFGSIMEKDEMFHDIPVAFVKSDEADNYVGVMLDAMSTSKEPMLQVEVLTEEEALDALQKKTVEGIIYEKDCSLVVAKDSLNSTILEEILCVYKQNEMIIKDFVRENAGVELDTLKQESIWENLDQIKDVVTWDKFIENTIRELMARGDVYKEKHFTEGSQNAYYNYFYAIFAMSCLFTAFSGLEMSNKLQADCGALGMRRSVAPTHKLLVIIAEFLAYLTLQFVAQLIALGYMRLLGMDFGPHIPQIIVILLLGVCIGLSIGIILGCIRRISPASKIGISIAIGMTLSVMADLVAGGLKRAIEKHAPLVNRLNPAALISDSFYCLGIYDDYQVFTRNIVILGVETAILLCGAYFMVRKIKYKEL